MLSFFNQIKPPICNLIPKQVKGFILDYRNSNFNIKIEEHAAIADFYKKHLDIFGGFKIAIITEEARDIVIPILVETEDEGYSSRPFSTLEVVVKWVLSRKSIRYTHTINRTLSGAQRPAMSRC